MNTPDARNRDADRPRTVGEVVDEMLAEWDSETIADEVAHICAALGIDPAAPLTNIVTLTEGQHVVEYLYVHQANDYRDRIPSFRRHVRSAVVPSDDTKEKKP